MSELRADFNALRSSAQGRHDPVGLRRIEGLLRRYEQSSGPLSEVLEARLATALARYRAAMPVRAAAQPARGAHPAEAIAGLRRQLAAVVADSSGRSLDETLRDQERQLVAAAQQGELATAGAAGAPELRARHRVRDAMVRLNADRVLEQARREVPEDAGPLNPQRLASGSLQTMNSLSPYYLTCLVSYLETLFWLEQADCGALD